METLHPRAMKEDELVVRIVAAGLCHSDVMTSLSAAIGGFSDRVLGHEGLFNRSLFILGFRLSI